MTYVEIIESDNFRATIRSLSDEKLEEIRVLSAQHAHIDVDAKNRVHGCLAEQEARFQYRRRAAVAAYADYYDRTAENA